MADIAGLMIFIIYSHVSGANLKTPVCQIQQVCCTETLHHKERRRACGNQRRNPRDQQPRLHHDSRAKPQNHAKARLSTMSRALRKHKKVIRAGSNPHDKRCDEKFKHD